MNAIKRGTEVLDFINIPVSREERTLMLLAQGLSYEVLSQRSSICDRENRFPIENYDDVKTHSFLDIRVPKLFGGKGVGSVAYSAIIVELAKGDPSIALCIAMHATVMAFIEHLADQQQQSFYFEQVIAKGKLFSPCTHEHGWNIFSGDLPEANLEKKNSGYILNGSKIMCPYPSQADYFFVNAALGPDVLGVIVPKGTDGVTLESNTTSTSLRSLQCSSVNFSNVFVKDSFVLKVPLNLLFELEYELGLCSCYIGIAEAIYRHTRESLKTIVRKTVESKAGHGHPDAGSAFYNIGKMRLAIEPAWLSILRAGQAGTVGSFERALTLTHAIEITGNTLSDVAQRALRLLKQTAADRDDPIERLARDALSVFFLGITPDDAAYLTGRFELEIAQQGIMIDRKMMRE